MKQGGSDEKVLLAGMRRGDPAAYTSLVDHYGGKIHALARRYARTEADAEDITQETLIEVCRSIASFRGEAALSTYIYRIAMNRCLKYRERQQRRDTETVPMEGLPLATGSQDDPAHHAARNELASEVNRALGTLSEGHREVVILHELHGLTYAECASVLNVPVGTVKSRLFNAFNRLRDRLSGYVRGEEMAPPGEGRRAPGDEEITAPKVALGRGGAR